MKPTLSADASAALVGLQKKWPMLTNDVDKAMALYAVYLLKVSTRVLAETLGCGATLIRNLIQAAKAPLADRLLAKKRKISTRELLRRSKAAAKLTKAKDLEALELKRTKQAHMGATVIAEWLKDEKLRKTTAAEEIVNEARRTLAAAKFFGKLPQFASPAGMPTAEVIQRFRPTEPLNGEIDMVAWYAAWLARWSFFAFPDEIVRDRALNLVLDSEVKA